jgi:hypothetical protein
MIREETSLNKACMTSPSCKENERMKQGGRERGGDGGQRGQQRSFWWPCGWRLAGVVVVVATEIISSE